MYLLEVMGWVPLPNPPGVRTVPRSLHLIMMMWMLVKLDVQYEEMQRETEELIVLINLLKQRVVRQLVKMSMSIPFFLRHEREVHLLVTCNSSTYSGLGRTAEVRLPSRKAYSQEQEQE